MNLQDFIIVVSVALLVGLVLGLLLRDLIGFIVQLYIKHIRKPRYFHPIDLEISKND